MYAQEIDLRPQGKFPAAAQPDICSASDGKGKLGPSTRDAPSRLRKVRSAEQCLGEWHDVAGLAIRQSRAEQVSFSRQNLRNMADVAAEIASYPEPIVGVPSDRAAAAIVPDGIALKNIEARVSHCDVRLRDTLRLRNCGKNR